MYALSICLAIASCLLGFGQADYDFTFTPAKIQVGRTENVKLSCLFTGLPVSTGLASVSRLRILKEILPLNFQIVAEVREHDSEANNIGLESAEVTGQVYNVTSSFISATWALAGSETLGRYRCDVVGFKSNDDPIVVKTEVVDIRSSDVTLDDFLNQAVKRKAEIQQKIKTQKANCENQVAELESYTDAKLTDWKNSTYNSSKNLYDSYLPQVEALRSNIQSLKDAHVFDYWPEGSFGLLMPDSGCPNSIGALWNSGLRKFHTESTDRNLDTVSNSSHLSKPDIERVGTDNFLNQHFCVSYIRSPGPDWPKGSYCINRVANGCPSGFNSGSIYWQGEITNPKAAIQGSLPDGVYTVNATRIYYCCRSDELPTNPVYLPLSKSFYLYRFNGTCQAVVGMTTSPGDMTFDTDNSNADSYENQYHPDGTINNVRLELCYYSVQ